MRELAHHYEKVLGATRHVVVWTTPSRIRRRYHFIVQESNRLEQVADKWLRQIDTTRETAVGVQLSLEETIAFWGRTLASLRTRRSRRRLSAEAVAIRETLSQKFLRGVSSVWRQRPTEVHRLLETRRPVEARWMLDALEKDQ